MITVPLKTIWYGLVVTCGFFGGREMGRKVFFLFCCCCCCCFFCFFCALQQTICYRSCICYCLVPVLVQVSVAWAFLYNTIIISRLTSPKSLRSFNRFPPLGRWRLCILSRYPKLMLRILYLFLIAQDTNLRNSIEPRCNGPTTSGNPFLMVANSLSHLFLFNSLTKFYFLNKICQSIVNR